MPRKAQNEESEMIDFPDQPEEETDAQIARRMWSDSDLREIHSWDDALHVAAESGEILRASEEIGSGFKILDDKDKLLKVPFMALEWRFNSGQYENRYGEKTDFVSVTVFTKHGDRYILNDGSTGIARQLRELSDRTGKYGPLYVEEGLRVSRDYPVTLPDGRKILGTTYYIA